MRLLRTAKFGRARVAQDSRCFLQSSSFTDLEPLPCRPLWSNWCIQRRWEEKFTSHQVVAEEEQSSAELINPQRLHRCSNLSRSSIGRCRNLKFGNLPTWIHHLTSHNQNFVYRLRIICIFLLWSLALVLDHWPQEYNCFQTADALSA